MKDFLIGDITNQDFIDLYQELLISAVYEGLINKELASTKHSLHIVRLLVERVFVVFVGESFFSITERGKVKSNQKEATFITQSRTALFTCIQFT